MVSLPGLDLDRTCLLLLLPGMDPARSYLWLACLAVRQQVPEERTMVEEQATLTAIKVCRVEGRG